MKKRVTTDEAIAGCVSMLSQLLDKSKDDVVKMLLIEALTARALMIQKEEETK